MVKIQIIVGSTRPNRFGIQPAQWLLNLAKSRTDAEFELVDLQKVALPFLDEPQSAVTGIYAHEHTKKWSAQVAAADGFVMVTPEYNHSYSPALKNAIDFLFAEWTHKPVSYLAYGAQTGGARAIEHLRGVAAQVKMFDLQEHLSVPNYWTQMNEQGEWQSTPEQTKTATAMLDALVFWSEQMKTARAELAAQQA